MLLRAARSPCWRVPARFLPPAYTVARSTPRSTAHHGTQLRVFTSQGIWRKQETGNTPPEQKPASHTAAPASRLANLDAAQNKKDSKGATTTKQNDLLSEATVGAQQQRKADWAIMKEMAKYLWPKVCFREASNDSTD